MENDQSQISIFSSVYIFTNIRYDKLDTLKKITTDFCIITKGLAYLAKKFQFFSGKVEIF